MPLTDWIRSISRQDSVFLPVSSSCIRFTALERQTFAKCPDFLQLLHLAFSAGQICSGVQLVFPQKLQFRSVVFLLPVNVAFFFVAGFVYPTCSSSDVLSEEFLRCLLGLVCLSPYLRFQFSNSMVSNISCNLNGPLIIFTRAFLSLMLQI